MHGKKLTEKERLFDLLIHDLTGPLSVISVSTTNLLGNTDRNGSLTDRQKSSLDRILRNVDKAQDILREMVEILRSEAGLFRKESFPVEKILKEVRWKNSARKKTGKGSASFLNPRAFSSRSPGNSATPRSATIPGKFGTSFGTW
jgi:light-regulated signal transduction histidine kinase (bacteriophytochrome)